MKSTAALLAFASAALFAATRKRKPSLSKAVSTSRGILGRAKESQLNARRVAEQTAERYMMYVIIPAWSLLGALDGLRHRPH
jgi:hypothetical protein